MATRQSQHEATAGEDPEREALAARMFDAVKALEQRERRDITLDELGVRIATAQGREEPYSGSVVRRWIKALSEPSTRVVWRAIADVLDVSPGWLAFGEAPAVARMSPTQRRLLDIIDRASAEGGTAEESGEGDASDAAAGKRVYGRQADPSTYVRGTTQERRDAERDAQPTRRPTRGRR